MGVGCWGLAVLGLGLGFEAEEDDHEVDDVVAHGGEHLVRVRVRARD